MNKRKEGGGGTHFHGEQLRAYGTVPVGVEEVGTEFVDEVVPGETGEQRGVGLKPSLHNARHSSSGFKARLPASSVMILETIVLVRAMWAHRSQRKIVQDSMARLC